MDWTDDVRVRLKRKNQILFSKTSPFLWDLIKLIDEQSHRTMVLWSLEFAQGAVEKLEGKYPGEDRPKNALEATKLWASGKVKMPTAKREILNCHAFAKDITSLEDIALCHAVGQACGVVHANGHAIGFPIYELTSIVYRLGIEACKAHVESRKQEYIERILYWKEHYLEYSGAWADFLRDS